MVPVFVDMNDATQIIDFKAPAANMNNARK